MNTDYPSEIGVICISLTIGSLRVNPFQSYPISGRLWISMLVNHCKLFSRRVIRSNEKRNLTNTTRPGPHGRWYSRPWPAWKPWPPENQLASINDDQSCFILGCDTSSCISLCLAKINIRSISANLLGLRCPGISSINHRLNNRGLEDTDDAMIGAIAKWLAMKPCSAVEETTTFTGNALCGPAV